MKDIDIESMVKKAKDEVTFTKAVTQLFTEYDNAHKQWRERTQINELMYMGKHWEAMRQMGMPYAPNDPHPVTPTIFSTIDNLEADLRDAFPEPVILPQRIKDKHIAKQMQQVLRQVYEDNYFEYAYEKWIHDISMLGTGVLEIQWDEEAQGGIGDVVVSHWDIQNFMADPTQEDLQKGRGIFKFTTVDLEYIKENYPDKYGEVQVEVYKAHDQGVNSPLIRDAIKKDEVILKEYWYKSKDKKGKTIINMAVIAGEKLLYNSVKDRPDGVYSHGEYPFAVVNMYPIKGSYLGFSSIDIFTPLQLYSDKLDQFMLKNAAVFANPRRYIRQDSEIDMEAVTDYTRSVVTGGDITEASVRWETPAALPSYMPTISQVWRDYIKDESGQNQFGRGEGGKGITAASAIGMLQNASSKRSRRIEKAIHRAFGDTVVYQSCELIRQFYGEERVFLVVEEDAQTGEKVESEMPISGQMLENQAQEQGTEEGIFNSSALIRFRCKTKVQRQKVYDSQYQNDLAAQFVAQGVPIDIVLPLMQFEGKEEIEQGIKRQMDLRQQLEQAQAQIEQLTQEMETKDDILNSSLGYQNEQEEGQNTGFERVEQLPIEKEQVQVQPQGLK